jgi:hypothetical protein
MQARQFSGASRALQRRGQHEREVVAGDEPAGTTSEILSSRRERDVGESGVPAELGPLRLAVTHQDELAVRVVRGGAVGQGVVGRHITTVLS